MLFVILGSVIGFGIGALVFHAPEISSASRFQEVSQVPVQQEISPDKTILRQAQLPMGSRMDEALQLKEPGHRQSRVSENLQEWMKNDPAAAIQWVISLPTGSQKSAAIRVVASALATSDPLSALQFVSENSSEQASSTVYHDILGFWARRDFQAALQWSLQSAENKTVFSQFVISAISPTTLLQAVQAIPSISDAHVRGSLVNRIAETWTSSDPNAAWQWAQSLPEKDRAMASGTVAAGIGSQDPVAASHLIDRFPAGGERSMAIAVLAGQWGHTDPNAAGRWLAGFKDPEEIRAGVEPLIRAWGAMEPNEAADWLDRLPAGTARDAGASALVGILTSWDPEAAISYSETISDPEQRAGLIIQTAKAWKRKNPAAATQWIQASNLPPNTKAKLLK